MKNVLFIGNSFTYYNDMPQKLFAPMAEAAGFPCCVTAVTKGWSNLACFLDEEHKAGQKLRAAIAGQHYDVVVLQEHGLRPICDTALFAQSVGAMLALLRPQAEKFLLYATPGRKEGHADLAELGLSSVEMTETLAEVYGEIGEIYGLPVAQTGRAFLRCAAEHPEAELYDADFLHPSALGSEVVAREILRAMMEAYGEE